MHLTFQIVFTLIAQVLSLKPIPSRWISGGTYVNITDYPYHVSLQYVHRAPFHWCSGCIISHFFVITAAHCTYWFKDTHHLQVRVGSSYIAKGDLPLVALKSLKQHPNFNIVTMENDITILELLNELIFSPAVQPVGLPSLGSTLSDNTLCNVTGWGEVIGNMSHAITLQVVRLPVVNRTECSSDYESEGEVNETMFCAGHRWGGDGDCQGDSGAPLVVNNILYGIVSWGVNCAQSDKPGVYTNVPSFRNYIKEITEL